jgi:hypothetical protein
MSIVYQGTTNGLIILPQDSISTAPSKLTTLRRTYSCSRDYLSTAISTLVPGYAAEGYSNLKLFTPPEQSNKGPVVEFSCIFYGYLSNANLGSANFNYSSKKVQAALTHTEIDGNGDRVDVENLVDCVVPVVLVSYISTDVYPSLIIPSNPPAESFHFKDTPAAGYTTGAGSSLIVSASQATRFYDVTEMVVAYEGVYSSGKPNKPTDYSSGYYYNQLVAYANSIAALWADGLKITGQPDYGNNGPTAGPDPWGNITIEGSGANNKTFSVTSPYAISVSGENVSYNNGSFEIDDAIFGQNLDGSGNAFLAGFDVIVSVSTTIPQNPKYNYEADSNHGIYRNGGSYTVTIPSVSAGT